MWINYRCMKLEDTRTARKAEEAKEVSAVITVSK